MEQFIPGKGTFLLVQSPVKPIEYGVIKILKGPGELNYRNMANGVMAKFILTANPVKMKSSDRNRVPHIGEENLKGWLNARVEAFGMLYGEIIVTPGYPIYFRKRFICWENQSGNL